MTAPPATDAPADAPVLHRTVIEPPSGWQETARPVLDDEAFAALDARLAWG